MNKLKTTFLRSHSTKHTDDRRSQQFANKLTASQFPPLDESEAIVNGPPALRQDELSEMEQLAYQTWWKDLDPFSIGHLDNEALLKFVRGCCLPDHKLEQILQLFKDARDGLSEQQFYAMLRLIAHAQNGRTISRDMVFLGAPVPRFKTNAIDALIKTPSTITSDIPAVTDQIHTESDNGNTRAWQQGTQASRNSWVQIDRTATQQRPTSWYVGQQPLTQYNTNIQPSAPLLSPPMPPLPTTSSFSGSTSKQSFGSGSSSSKTGAYETSALPNLPVFQWPQLPSLQSPSNHPASQSSTTMGAGIRSEQKMHPYTHSRSRSVPYSVPQPPPPPQPNATAYPARDPNSLFVFDTVAATSAKQQQQQQQQQHRPAPLTSRASMDADSFQRLSSAIDTGQSLLLTKKFVPPKASNNPFESAIEESPRKEPSTLSYSPFADQVSNDSDVATLSASVSEGGTRVFDDDQPEERASALLWPTTSKANDHPNKQHLYPPPVPSQATKPAFLKYSRNAPPGSLRRTQSYGARAFKSTPDTPLDPFNTSTVLDSPPFSMPSTETSYTIPNNSTNVSISEFSHGNKLFRRKSDGSSLIRR